MFPAKDAIPFIQAAKVQTQMKFDRFRLVSCSECRRREIQKVSQRMQTRLAQHLAQRANQPAKTKRTIYRDVAMRYIIRFEGKTDAVQTDADACDVFLKNRYGQIIGQVSAFDRFSKPPPAESVADMPY